MRKSFKYRSSIYGHVIRTITLLSLFLFISFGIVFRSVNEKYLNRVISQNGDNISSIVQGSLYHSMLANDRSTLMNTLDVINTLPGIEDVNMYDHDYRLIYSPFSKNSEHNNPDCIQCHTDMKAMFPGESKSFRIINMDNECEMSKKDYDYRLLLINSPIRNERSCYTAACHAHPENQAILGSFIIRMPLEDLDSTLYMSSLNFYVLAAIITIFLAVFITLFMRKKIKHPLDAIIKASEAVSKGDRSTRLEIKPGNVRDMKMVASAFNEMLDNLDIAANELKNWSEQLEYKVRKKTEELEEIQNELIHVEKIASLGKLSSSIAHEINNPLSGVLTYTKLVQKQIGKSGLDEAEKKSMLTYLKVVEDETKRCGDIVKSLLEFSKKDQSDFIESSLHKLLKEASFLMDHQMKISNITFRSDLNAMKERISCNENQIKHASLALLMNACEAVTGTGEIILKTTNPDSRTVKIQVIDNGVGIDPADMPHIFDPFFSAKEKPNGTGLGLSVVHGIVESHKGKLEVQSEPGKGTVISVILPVIDGE